MDGGIHVCMYVRTYVCMCVYVCMYKCVCVCMCVCMYVSTTGQSLHYLSGRKQYTCCTLSYQNILDDFPNSSWTMPRHSS